MKTKSPQRKDRPTPFAAAGAGRKMFGLCALVAAMLVWAAGSPLAADRGGDLPQAVQRAVYEAQQDMTAKKYAEAEKKLLAYERSHPDAPHYLVAFTLGNVFSYQGKNQAALERYRACAELNPGFGPVWQNLGKTCFDLKQYSRAGEHFFKAWQTGTPKDPKLRYHAAVAWMLAGENRKALAHLESLVSGDAGRPEKQWIEALLKVSLDLGRDDKAVEALGRILEKKEGEARWWKLLAQLHARRQEYRKAVSAFEVHALLVPALGREDAILMGDLYSAIHIPLKAAQSYRSALAMRDCPKLRKKLAAAWMAAHRPDEARETMLAGPEPLSCPRIWLALGRTYYDRGDWEKALDAFSRSARLAPEDGRAHLMLGHCALQLQKKQIAVAALRKACEFKEYRRQAGRLLEATAAL
jgi:tetratricopeptide (TPR) repeat protein